MAEGFELKCKVCPFWQIWSTELAAQCAATWHTYEQHHEDWLKIIGDRGPQDPRPWQHGMLLAAPPT